MLVGIIAAVTKPWFVPRPVEGWLGRRSITGSIDNGTSSFGLGGSSVMKGCLRSCAAEGRSEGCNNQQTKKQRNKETSSKSNNFEQHFV